MGSKPAKLAAEDFNDLHKNTSFTEEEISNWYKRFIKECPSGELTFNQFQEMYRSIFPNGNAIPFSKHVFRTIDTNNDGVIDFKEFLTAYYLTSRASIDRKLKMTFSMYDVDKNGSITGNEMVEVLRAIYTALGVIRTPEDEDLPRRRAADFFRRLDRNMDGSITQAEFIQEGMLDPHIKSLVRSNPLLLC